MELQQFEALRRSVETSFGSFDYVELGEGPPALFVHGLFVSAYLWKDVIEGLADRRRCVAFNLPGHGRTHVAGDQPLTLPATAEMIEAFCDALGLDRVDLVANDTGGAIAQAFAVRCPERLRTLTLTNCECRDVLPSPEPLPQLALQLARDGQLAQLVVANSKDLELFRGEGGLGLLHQWPERLDEDDMAGYRGVDELTLEQARVIERFLVELHPDDLVALEPGLRRLEVPTLIAWGTGDPFFPLELGRWLRDTIAGARALVEVDGGRLFWPFERPRELVEPLRAHLDAHAPEAAAA